MAPGTEPAPAQASSTPAASGPLQCVKCSRDVSESDAFCIYCGTKVSVTLAQRQQQSGKSAKPDMPSPKPKTEALKKPDMPPPKPTTEAPVKPDMPPPKPKTEAPKKSEAPASKKSEAPAPKKPEASKPKAEASKKPTNPPKASGAKQPPAAPSSSSSSTKTAPTSQESTRSLPTSSSSTNASAKESKPAASAPQEAKPTKTQSAQELRSHSQSQSRDSRSSRDSFDHSHPPLKSAESAPPVALLEQLWVPDNFASDCMDCGVAFGWPKPRRHHCRVCGLLFCRNCVQNKMQIPPSFGYGNNMQRCCRNCITALQTKAITTPADVFAQRKGGARQMSKSSHYDLLGIGQDASPEEINQRYHDLTLTMNPENKDDKEQIEQINQAYEALRDPSQRSRHDSELNRTSSQHETQFISETARSGQTECQVCFRPFKLGRRQHHCRRCTRSVCNQCSEGTKAIPELGFPQPVRHCSACLDNPPKFVKPVLEAVAKPPAGFEFLSKLDVHVDVKPQKSSGQSDDEPCEVKLFCEPNADAVKQANYTLTDSDRQLANEYSIVQARSFPEFEWLFQALGEHTNIKALPFFPEKRVAKSEREKKAEQLQTFLYGCLLHPLLRDLDCLKAFLVLPPDEFSSFRRNGAKGKLYQNAKYSPLTMSLRLEFEKAQIRSKVDELKDRDRAHKERMKEQQKRLEQQKRREEAQKQRRDRADARYQALEARKESQTERMEREKDRYEKQSGAVHILFFDTVRDEAERQAEEECREKEKIEFTKSKDSFQADTVEWNSDMASWSKHRADWSEHNNPALSRDIANAWIMRSYGVYYSHPSDTSDVPKDLVDLQSQMVKMQEKEPEFLEAEGEAVDDEWMKLAKEREHWTQDRSNMKREDTMCKDEDVRYDQEHNYVKLEKEARQKKVSVINADLEALKRTISNCGRSIAQRRTRHEALQDEYDNEWCVIQAKRDTDTNARLKEHDARISRGKKRSETFKDQLERQTNSKRMLLFKRAALTEERKKDVALFGEHKEDCKTALEAARSARTVTPEYVSRLEADMKIRTDELQIVIESNKRTAQEGGDADVDERDEFMNQVRERRKQFQQELDDQKVQLETENKLCSGLLKSMHEFIAKLDKEVENAGKEDEFISTYDRVVEEEKKLVQDEEAKREEKKAAITELMNDAGNWVLEALHEHSKRKKREADRLVKQAVRAADLQTLVQHFTHRVIEQEERIMRQKQRILNGEHKVEMLKSSENWYQYVTGHSPDLSKKDYKVMEAGQAQRQTDLKEASRLQKEDGNDKGGVDKELGTSRDVSKDKEEKRNVWAQVEDVYAQEKPQEKDEDMMMTSQIRGLLQQLGEAFEMLTNRLMEEEDSLTHAISQLDGEVESIHAFMERMESEENALCTTEKNSLSKESQVRHNESDLIEQRARALIDSYKQMQKEHSKYPVELEKIKSQRSGRDKPVAPRDGEVEAAKKMMQGRNYYDKKACAEFAKKFKAEGDLKDARSVLEWLKLVVDTDIKRDEKWLDASRKERKAMEALKVKGLEVDWDQDLLARIPAVKNVKAKLLAHSNKAEAAKNDIHPSEQWIVDLITLRKSIEDIDSGLLKSVDQATASANQEEKTVQGHLHTIKDHKEYILNSLRFIDQEEAKAVRSTGKGMVNGRRTPTDSDNGSLLQNDDTPRGSKQEASRVSSNSNKDKATTPKPSPKDKAPVASPKNKAPVASPKNKAPVASPKNKAPVASPKDKPTKEKEMKPRGPAPKPEDKTPVKAARKEVLSEEF